MGTRLRTSAARRRGWGERLFWLLVLVAITTLLLNIDLSAATTSPTDRGSTHLHALALLPLPLLRRWQPRQPQHAQASRFGPRTVAVADAVVAVVLDPPARLLRWVAAWVWYLLQRLAAWVRLAWTIDPVWCGGSLLVISYVVLLLVGRGFGW